MKDIDTLRLFLAVAEEGSFARGARRLALSPAVATRRIAALEAELSVRLFARSTRKIELTTEGWLLHEHARAIVEAVVAAEDALRAAHAQPRGRLRVLARAGLGRHIVVPALPAFRARYPDIEVALHLTEARVLDVQGVGCDVGITIGHLADSSLVARRLIETDSLVCASPAYLQRRGQPRHPEDLERHDCLTINADENHATWRFSRGTERSEVRFRAPLAVNDADALMAFARSGLGIVLVADWTAREDLARGSLVEVLGDFQVEPRGTPITALYPSRRYLPAKVGAFLDFMAEYCAERFAPETARSATRT